MDPLSALSVAAAVVQFIELGGKVVSTYCEVRNTAKGQPAEVVSLAANASDLSSVAVAARSKLKGLGSSYPRHEESLLRLMGEMTHVESKIDSAIQKLTVNPKKYATESGTRVWWRSGPFGRRQSWTSGTGSSIGDEAQKVDTRTEHILQAVERIERTMAARSTLSEDERLQIPNQKRMHEAIWASTALSNDAAKSEGMPRVTCRPVLARPPTKEQIASQREVIRSLKYDEIKNRSKGIKAAFPDTFQWIFEDNTHCFRTWLMSQDKTIFWITGVPASGKSTLMKFIIEHPKLADLLRIWSGQDNFCIAKFYFWNPGSRIQKSRVGLLRSLLFQLLDIHSAGTRIVLFIDGLDEYEDFVEDDLESIRITDELVALFVRLHKVYEVKLCVSSRPLNYFRDTFKDCPSLALQDLTQPDIDHYIQVRLGSSEAIKEIRSLEEEAVDQLVFDLKSKAQGVFFWVILVVEQLLLTCQAEPHMKAVRSVFDSLPEGLVNLYDAILQKTGSERQVDKEAVMAKLTRRLVEGHTRGILQTLGSTSYGSPATIDFLHKTAFEWIQQPGTWDRIIAIGPPGYSPGLAIIAVLVSRMNSPGFLSHNMNLRRIVVRAAYLPDTPDSRAQLASIIDRLDKKDLILSESSPARITSPEQRSLTWAAAWACHSYIQGKMDQPNAIFSAKVEKPRYSLLSRRNRDIDVQTSLLEVAIFDVDHADLGGLNIWQASQRLITIKMLLQRGARFEKYMLERLRRLAKRDNNLSRYAKLLLAMSKDRNPLENFDARVEAAYPETAVERALADILSTM
ncbi:hypothetical protein BJY01DRAFT_255184 [Aspergillus pseudoustus]|uniref:Nephrocystin 3-like N-terminal domain-containing protein n=1 Tax=Aspergillus pseudoustus TaxID=1810923 RepID=A0ABR4IQF6_9EURO